MRIHAARVAGYRSVQNIQLDDCGSFNVLIGKNNSGKSNILSAIECFFINLRNDDIVEIDGSYGRDLDFFGRDLTKPISISVDFELSLAEVAAIRENIESERPQLKTAAQQLESCRYLSLTQCAMPSPRQFIFVRRIELMPGADAKSSRPQILLDVSDNTAIELYDRATSVKIAKRALVSLEEFQRYFDEDDWRMTRGPERAFTLSRRFGERLPRDLLARLENNVQKSDNYNEFITSIKELESAERDKIEVIESQALKSHVRTFSGDEERAPEYISRLLETIANIKVLHFKERRQQIGREEAQRLLALKTRRGGTERLRSLQQTVEGLLGVKVDAFESGNPPPGIRNREASAELDVDDFLVEVNGSGIREALRLILDIEFQQPDILLVEEPEIHLHPALETSMMRYLMGVSGTSQIFITTHSTNFLDTIDMQTIYLVSKKDSTTVSRLDYRDAETRIPRELGIRLSSLFMYDKVVFVEGPSDEKVIVEWAKKIGTNLSNRNIGFIPIRGVRNLFYYAAAEVLEFLSRRRVDTWFILDSDERTLADIENLKKRAPSTAKFHFTKRRELENYLLSTRVNCSYLRERLGPSIDVSEDKFESNIRECAESLKSFSIWKRVERQLGQPVYWKGDQVNPGASIDECTRVAIAELSSIAKKIADRQASLEVTIQNAIQDVTTRWDTDKLALVPGTELLDAVYARYGLRFDKMRDGVRLAALMEASEIDAEFTDLLRKIGAPATVA